MYIWSGKMDSEDKFQAILVVTIGAVGTILTLGCISLAQYNARKMAALGYQQVMVPGNDSPVWQKVLPPQH
jgi:hypothetical protein